MAQGKHQHTVLNKHVPQLASMSYSTHSIAVLGISSHHARGDAKSERCNLLTLYSSGVKNWSKTLTTSRCTMAQGKHQHTVLNKHVPQLASMS